MSTSLPSDEHSQSVPTWVATAVAASRTARCVRIVRRWSENAVLFAVVASLIRRLSGLRSRWVGGSRLCQAVSRLVDRCGATLFRWGRHSRGYRWLSAEPDPDAIVIDLRETTTVAPFIAVLDRALAVGLPAVAHARTVGLFRRAVSRGSETPLRFAGGGLLVVAGVGAVRAVAFGFGSWLAIGVVIGLALLGVRFSTDRRSWAELRTARPIRVLAALLVPPESSDEDSSARADENRGSGCHPDDE